MENRTTVVVLRSLSFTGTTWINCLLGCQERSFALGPPDRVIQLFDKGDTEWLKACHIHGADCTFWTTFAKTYDPKQNFYLQLAEFSGRDFIVINNPTPGAKATLDLKHPNIVCKPINIVRDGRAVCSSYLDKFPDKDFLFSMVEWFSPSAFALFFDEQDPDTLCLRYEDVVADQTGMLKRIGRFLGLEYPSGAHRFWEFDHHLVSGNRSMVGMIRRFELDKPFSGKDSFYENEYQRLCREPDKPIVDERWKDRLGRQERFLFDMYCGQLNESWGYPRDAFTATEFETLEREHRLDGNLPEAQSPRFTTTPDLAAGRDWKSNLRRLRTLIRNGGVIPSTLLRWFLKRLVVSWGVSLLLAIIVAVFLTRIIMG